MNPLAITDGDDVFTRVDTLRPAHKLEKGVAADASNKRFDEGKPRPRFSVNLQSWGALTDLAANHLWQDPIFAPSNLAAAMVSISQIDLSWTNNGTATAIIVYRGTVSGTYSVVATLDPTDTSYSDTGLAASTHYFYVIRAQDADGNVTAATAEADATTDALAVTAPTAPSALTATTISKSAIDLDWTDNSGDETGFIISRSTSPLSGFVDIYTTAADATSYSDTGLSELTDYYYKVRATKGGGLDSNPTTTALASTWSEPVAMLYSSAHGKFYGGASLPAGNYQLAYVSGAVQPRNNLGWLITIGDTPNVLRFSYYLNGVLSTLPVLLNWTVANTYQVSGAAVESTYAGIIPVVPFTHSGGPIELIFTSFGNYYDSHGTFPFSTFQLRRVP